MESWRSATIPTVLCRANDMASLLAYLDQAPPAVPASSTYFPASPDPEARPILRDSQPASPAVETLNGQMLEVANRYAREAFARATRKIAVLPEATPTPWAR